MDAERTVKDAQIARGDFLGLAARCEREGPSDELNWSITEAARPDHRQTEATHYTTSLDAAVTLVPAGAWRETNGPRRYLNIPSPSPNYWRTEITTWEPRMRDSIGWAATEALSICAAALKARAVAP